MNINEVVQAKMSEMTKNGKVEEIVEKHLTESVESAVSDCFRSYSDFTKSLTDHIKESVAIDFDQLGIAGYNDFILKVIKLKIGHFFEEVAKKEIEEELDELLREYPKKIKLSELIDRFKEHCAGKIEEWEYSEGTIILEGSDCCDGYYHLFMDSEANTPKYRCSYQIDFNKDEVYSVEVNGEDFKKRLFLGPCYNFERFLLHAYTNKIKIEVDQTDFDEFYGHGEHEAA